MGKKTPSNSSLLPDNLQSSLEKTEVSIYDEITDLKGQLSTADDSLKEQEAKVKSLESEIKELRENFPIKQSAVRFAYSFLILIPVICFVLFIVSVTKGVKITSNFGFTWDVNWDVNIESYTQSALIITPIIFVATVLGFMLRGVFGQKENQNAAITTELIKHLKQ